MKPKKKQAEKRDLLKHFDLVVGLLDDGGVTDVEPLDGATLHARLHVQRQRETPRRRALVAGAPALVPQLAHQFVVVSVELLDALLQTLVLDDPRRASAVLTLLLLLVLPLQ